MDDIFCRRCSVKEIGDCNVAAGENVVRKHRIAVCALETKKGKQVKEGPRFKMVKVVAGRLNSLHRGKVKLPC